MSCWMKSGFYFGVSLRWISILTFRLILQFFCFPFMTYFSWVGVASIDWGALTRTRLIEKRLVATDSGRHVVLQANWTCGGWLIVGPEFCSTLSLHSASGKVVAMANADSNCGGLPSGITNVAGLVGTESIAGTRWPFRPPTLVYIKSTG